MSLGDRLAPPDLPLRGDAEKIGQRQLVVVCAGIKKKC
jgi:hypothetical protein